MKYQDQYLAIQEIKRRCESVCLFMSRRPLARKVLLEDEDTAIKRKTLEVYKNKPEFMQFMEDCESLRAIIKKLNDNPIEFIK